MGCPKFVPTAAQRKAVRIAVACGAPHEAISQGIKNRATGKPITAKTLRAVFRAELNDGKGVANALVAKSLFRKATGDGPQSVTAAIFWLKTQMGWKEPADAPPVDDAARKIREALREMDKVSDGSTAPGPVAAVAPPPDPAGVPQ